jgi:hypothetical protein
MGQAVSLWETPNFDHSHNQNQRSNEEVQTWHTAPLRRDLHPNHIGFSSRDRWRSDNVVTCHGSVTFLPVFVTTVVEKI